MASDVDDHAILTIQRPVPTLWKYYVITSFLWGPLFPIPLIVQYLRYRTLQYQFDQTGITMRWGSWSRREVSVAYTRIQDIHVRSNIIERWLNLAKIEIQTASSNTRAELILEGIPQYAAVRDFLYDRMQDTDQTAHGSRRRQTAGTAPSTISATSDGASQQALTEILHQVVVELRAIRTVIEQQAPRKEDTL